MCHTLVCGYMITGYSNNVQYVDGRRTMSQIGSCDTFVLRKRWMYRQMI